MQQQSQSQQQPQSQQQSQQQSQSQQQPPRTQPHQERQLRTPQQQLRPIYALSQPPSSSSDDSDDAPATALPLGPVDRRFEEEIWPNPHDIIFMSSKARAFWGQVPALQDFKSPEILAQHLDFIEPQTVARITARAHELQRAAPTFAKRILDLMLEEQYLGVDSATSEARQNRAGLELREDSDTAARIMSKGMPSDTVRPIIAKAILSLYDAAPKEKFPLYEDPELEKIWQTARRIRRCKRRQVPHNFTEAQVRAASRAFSAGMSVVNKSDLCNQEDCKLRSTAEEGKEVPEHFKQRLILDGRMANAHLQNPAFMDIFRLEVLFDIFARCKQIAEGRGVKSSFYTVAADLRHWFHQIPMPRRFRAAYGSDMGKHRNSNGKLRRRVLFPRTWPMGASPAAGLGQAVTWSLLLHGLESNPQDRKPLGIDWPEDKNFDVYLPWLPLKCGGGVFVLIDNIYVITTENSIARNWERRIRTATTKFNAELKHDKIEVVELSAQQPQNSTDFTGVIFDWNGRRPRDPIDVDPALEAHRTASTAPATWSGTFRSLASIVGQCLWIYRIGCEPLFSNENYRTVSKAAYPSPTETWDSPVSLNTAQAQALLAMYKHCRNSDLTFPHPAALRSCKSIGYLATDAAYAKEIAHLGYAYSFSATDDPVRSKPIVRHGPSQIAIEELRAVLLGLKAMAQEQGGLPDLVMVGIDSTHAKGMIANGIARTDEAIAILKEIHETLGSTRIYLTHVPSALNPSDCLTRREDKVWEPEQWSDLVAKLMKLVPLATVELTAVGARILSEKIPRRRKTNTK